MLGSRFLEESFDPESQQNQPPRQSDLLEELQILKQSVLEEKQQNPLKISLPELVKNESIEMDKADYEKEQTDLKFQSLAKEDSEHRLNEILSQNQQVSRQETIMEKCSQLDNDPDESSQIIMVKNPISRKETVITKINS